MAVRTACDRYLMRNALIIVEQGMAVFPLRPGSKLPALGRGWQQRVTRDPDVVRRVWRSAPYNIGVATGEPSSILVVDLDAPPGIGLPHGRQVLAGIARAADAEIPRDTRTVLTPNGGQHLYFRLPDGIDLRNTAGLEPTSTRGEAADTWSARVRRSRAVATGWYARRLHTRYPTGSSNDFDPRHPSVDLSQLATRRYRMLGLLRRGDARRSRACCARRRRNAEQHLVPCRRPPRPIRCRGRVSEREVSSVLTAACSGHIEVGRFTATEVERAIASGLRRATAAPTTRSNLAQRTRADGLTPFGTGRLLSASPNLRPRRASGRSRTRRPRRAGNAPTRRRRPAPRGDGWPGSRC